MEVLSPSYLFLIELIITMEGGVGARNFIQEYLPNHKNEWSIFLSKFVFKVSNNNWQMNEIETIQNPYERAIITLIYKSFQGEPVLEELKNIESQYYLAHQKILDKHLLKLPYLSLVPLFVFLFPAYLILMLGPVLMSLIKGLS